MASHVHRADNNNVFFLLVTCLLSSPKKQMPEISRMAVNWMPLHPQLPLSVISPTLSLPCHPMPSWNSQTWTGVHILRVWHVLVESSHQLLDYLQPKSLECAEGSSIPNPPPPSLFSLFISICAGFSAHHPNTSFTIYFIILSEGELSVPK